MTKYITITLFAYAINLPMGALMAKSKKLIMKLVYIHLPVPILVALRKTWQLDDTFIVVIIGSAILGLLSGKYLHNNQCPRAAANRREEEV
jgi:hypothetical protein